MLECLPRSENRDDHVGVGELMYMRAKFEGVVVSKDSEAFYMIKRKGHGSTEL